jgi:small multidrug resistance pump
MVRPRRVLIDEAQHASRAFSRGPNLGPVRYDELKTSFGSLPGSVTLASETLMEKRALAVVVTIAFSVVGVVGDYLLKRASEATNPVQSRWFYVGFAVYASTAFGWVFVMRHLKLATIGVVYSVSMILLLTTIGIVFFREPLNRYEIAGLAMAVGSLILLIRFA